MLGEWKLPWAGAGSSQQGKARDPLEPVLPFDSPQQTFPCAEMLRGLGAAGFSGQ